VIARRRPRQWILLREWLLLALVAMLVCSFFGGAVADPQYRYQGRLIWLVPFFAAIALCLWRRAEAGIPKRRDGTSESDETATVTTAAS